MSKEKSVILSVHHRGDPIEYRPHAHHALHVVDDTFDFKFSSYLWCESLLQEIRKRSFDYHASTKVKELSSLLDTLPKNEADMSILQLAHLQSALSDPDRAYLIQRIVSMLGNVKGVQKNLVFAQLHQSNLHSCHDVLCEVAADLARQPRVQTILRKLPAQVSSVYTNEQLRQRNPLQFIAHIMSLFSEALNLDDEKDLGFLGAKEVIPTFIMVIPFFERLDCDVVTEVVQTLQAQSWRTVLLLSSSDLASSRLYLDNDLQAGIAMHKFDLCTPMDLYNQVAAEVLPTNKLPVHFPSTVIRSLHQEFTSFTFCTSTFLKRLLTYVEQHFTQRKGLLCMSSQWEWLQMMNIITKKANRTVTAMLADVPQNVAAENRESFIKAISELLSYLDKADIENTKLKLSDTSDVKRSKEIESALNSLLLYQDFRILSRIVFTLLESLRDFLLPSHHQAKFCSALLWAGLMDKSLHPRPCSYLREFQSVVCDQMMQVPVKTLAACTRDLVLLSQTKLVEQVNDADMSTWLKKKSEAMLELQETLDMMKDLLEGDGTAMNMSFQKMEASVVGTERTSSLAKKVSVDVSTSSSNTGLDAQEQPGVSIELGTLDIIREMIADFSNWLTLFLSDYARLASHADGLSGVVYISCEVEQHTQEILNSNLRKQFMSGLLEPSKYLKASSSSSTIEPSIPDVCHLSDKVKFGQPLEIAHGWMEYFQGKTVANKWEIGDFTSKSKKRPRWKASEDVDLLEQATEMLDQTILKGRFVNAVYDIEKSGVISSRKIDRGDIVIAKQIYTGI